MGSNPYIKDFKEIVPACEGCERICKTIYGKRICSCNVFPETKWWFESCPNATHIEYEEHEDPVKEP